MRLTSIICLFISLSLLLSAQEFLSLLIDNQDELLQNDLNLKQNSAEYYYRMGDLELEKLNIKVADSLYDLGLENSTSDSSRIQLYLRKGELSTRNNNTESLFANLNKLVPFFNNNSLDKDDLYSYHMLWADYYQSTDNFISELDHLLKAKSIVDPKEHTRLLNLNRELSIIYFRLYDYEASLSLFQEDLSIAEQLADNQSIMFSYYGIADCCLQLNRLKEVKKVCFKAIEFHEEAQITEAFGFIYSLLGTVYVKEEKLDSAYYFANKGITISENQKEKKELADNYLVMVDLLLINGDTLGAQSYAERAVEMRNFHDAVLNNNLAMIYESQSKYSSANSLLRKNLNYYEKIKDKDYMFSIAGRLLEDKFQQEKINQIALEKQKFQKTQIQLVLTGVGILFTFLLVIIAIQNSNKQKVQKVNSDLVEKNEELQHFAYICSHDLKESIRNIGSFSSLLKFKLKNEELKFDHNEHLNIIEMGVSTLTNIVDSLQVFTSIKEDKVIDKTHFHLVLLLHKVEQTLFQLIREKDVTISIHDELDNRQIYSSENELFLIFQNIIQNAIKHNESENVLVDIRIFQKDTSVIIAIKDNGIGISPNYFDHIFMPFKTLKNKSISNTSGLGLTICAKLIQNIGGEISVESKEGKGSTFYVKLGKDALDRE